MQAVSANVMFIHDNLDGHLNFKTTKIVKWHTEKKGNKEFDVVLTIGKCKEKVKREVNAKLRSSRPKPEKANQSRNDGELLLR